MGGVGVERPFEAIFALAVPAWHRTIQRTVFYRIYGNRRCDNYGSKPYYNKYGPCLTNCIRTVPYNSTSLKMNGIYAPPKGMLLFTTPAPK